jgi:two-component system cell cycle sensor histidine kinase/response regulator CckA
VVMSVRDSGTGMDSTTMSRIFEPFFTTKEKGRGTGLGLPTVYGIVKQSGGHIAVQSTLGVGTEFCVYLPAARVLEPDTSHEEAAPTPREPGQGTILLVEDDAAVRQFISSVLGDLGYQVLTAEDGEHAAEVSEAYEGPIDLLISDVVMPRMSGYELARQLSARRSGLRVLYLSGYSEDTFADWALKPLTRLLPKPFSPQQLGAKVQEMLGGAL